MNELMQKIAVLLGVFLLAFGLRLWGIDNGLPYVQRPDETGDISQSLQIVQGDIPSYAYHRVTWSIVQIPLHATHFLIQKVTHPDFGLADFEASYYTDRGSFILSTRIYSAFWAALACVLVALAGYKLSDSWWAALLAGGLLAVHPEHVYLSHMALPDAFATTWVALSLLGSVGMVRTQKRLYYILAGVGVSLAALARLQTLPGLLALVGLAHLVAWWVSSPRSWRFLFTQWLWLAGAFLLSQIVFNPFIVLAPSAVWSDIRFIFTERYTGTHYNQQPSYHYSPFTNLQNNASLPMILVRPYFVAFFIVAMGLAVLKRHWAALVVTLGGLALAFSILPTLLPRITYWLPVVIPVATGIGWGFYAIWDSKRTWVRSVVVVLALVLFGLALTETVKIDHTLAQTDTQMLAYQYAVENIPAGARVMVGDTFIYSVPLPRTLESMQRLEEMGRSISTYEFFLQHPSALPTPAYDIYGYEYARAIQSDESMIAFMEENDIEYLIEADYCGGLPTYETVSGLTYPLITSEIREDLSLIYTASPFWDEECQQHIENRTHMEYMDLWDWQRVGPIVRVYQRP